MGCDIHCYVEYKKPTDKQARSFGGRINPGRHYQIFAKLAGVRSQGEEEPIVPPRGFPSDAGWYADDDNHLFVTDVEGEGYVKPSTAKMWVDSGSSKFKPGSNKWITHPDWHSHSWVTTEEWAKAIAVSNEYVEEYKAILAAMKSLEADGYMARVVFWFDN